MVLLILYHSVPPGMETEINRIRLCKPLPCSSAPELTVLWIEVLLSPVETLDSSALKRSHLSHVVLVVRTVGRCSPNSRCFYMSGICRLGGPSWEWKRSCGGSQRWRQGQQSSVQLPSALQDPLGHRKFNTDATQKRQALLTTTFICLLKQNRWNHSSFLMLTVCYRGL